MRTAFIGSLARKRGVRAASRSPEGKICYSSCRQRTRGDENPRLPFGVAQKMKNETKSSVARGRHTRKRVFAMMASISFETQQARVQKISISVEAQNRRSKGQDGAVGWDLAIT